MSNKGFTNDAIPALSACESPIEGKFVQAWFDAMRELGASIEYQSSNFCKVRALFSLPNNISFRIDLQCKLPCLNGGRVDALVTMSSGTGFVSHAIEIDGCKFHASAEQQQQDRHRDRALLFAGFPVVRYAGNEVYSNSALLVLELIGALAKKIEGNDSEAQAVFDAGFSAGDRLSSDRTSDDYERFKEAGYLAFLRGVEL